uniref:5'-3' DNA helicase ZGRF1-like N-terminal domain-containing protein n=1 Tax=Noccaea caerulescens TaxID=107243 RepID=A0A1J3GXI3_NOCCA
MAEKKRWIAMYTKHIKQKRKVYHDGFLDLQITRRKVMLYDEADNLLESRMLKADEVVSSGESLTFQAYLVDVGDPKDGNKPSSDPEVQPSDQVCVRKPFAALRPNFKTSSLHCEEKKPNLMNKFPSQSLSPSHKMIRVFKKRELHKYGTLSPDNVKPTTTGTLPLGSANKGSNSHPLINSPCDDFRRENDKLSKVIPPQKPLRDVNQILSILQRPTVTETCFDNNLKTSMSSTKIPPESDISKNDIMASVSSRGTSENSLPQQFMVRKSSTANTTVSSTTHLSDPPSFDLGI